MLTCREVRDHLPGILTGEAATPEERDHLASCDTCRAEQKRLEDELMRARRALAALSPSPFLEEEVVEALESAQPVSRRPWGYVVAALVTAAALIAVLIVERRRTADLTTSHEEQEVGPTAGEPRLWVPPSWERIDHARSVNSVGAYPSAEWRWTDETRELKLHQEAPEPVRIVHPSGLVFLQPGKSGTRRESAAFLPPTPGCLHRWVYGDEASSTTVLGERADPPLPSGELRLGRRVLDRLAVAEGASFEAYLAAPHEGADEVRIRVCPDAAYRNWLAIPSSLARALRLYTFELPGRSVAAPLARGVVHSGGRAWARLRVPDPDFDDVIEVEVIPPPSPVLPELDPRMAATKVKAPADPAWTQRIPEPLRTLTLRPIEHTHAFIVGVPGGEDRVPCLLFAASPWRADQLHRLDLSGAWPVGTLLTLAQIWRDTTAIPAGVSVVRLRVEEEGRARGWIVVETPAAHLRALVERPDGTRRFESVHWEPKAGSPHRKVRGTIDGGGRLDVGGGVPPADSRDWDALRRTLTAAPTLDLEEAASARLHAALELEVSPVASWAAVERVLEAATREGLRTVRFADGPTIPFTVLSPRLFGGRGEILFTDAVTLRVRNPIQDGDLPVPRGEAPARWLVRVEGEAAKEALPVIRLLNRVGERKPSQVILSRPGGYFPHALGR